MSDNTLKTLTDKTYTIKFDATQAIIFDEAGEVCNPSESQLVALALAEIYAPGAYVYIGKRDNNAENNPYAHCYKIGMSYNLRQRQQQLGIKVIHTIPCANSKYARVAEGMLHTVFKDYCIGGEWFELEQDEVDDVIHIETYHDVEIFYWEQSPLTISYLHYPPGTRRHFTQTLLLIKEAEKNDEEITRRDLLHIEELRALLDEEEERILHSRG